MKGFQYLAKKGRLKRLVKKITRLIYSDALPIGTEVEQERFIHAVATPKDKIHLLEIYLAIQLVAVQIGNPSGYTPINDADIKGLMRIIDDAIRNVAYFHSAEMLDLDIEKNLLGVQWQLKKTSYYLERGREAFKQNQYSPDGRKYYLEKRKKGPL